jgi:hypothetical protein
MQNEHASIVQFMGTLFQGGALVVLLGIAWKGATFVQWTRGTMFTLLADFARFEQNNTDDHDVIKDRLRAIENNGKGK